MWTAVVLVQFRLILSFIDSIPCHFEFLSFVISSVCEKSKIIFQNQDSSHSLRSVRNDSVDGFLTFVWNDNIGGVLVHDDIWVNGYLPRHINTKPEDPATKFIKFCTVPVVTSEHPPVFDFLSLLFWLSSSVISTNGRNLTVFNTTVRSLTLAALGSEWQRERMLVRMILWKISLLRHRQK